MSEQMFPLTYLSCMPYVRKSTTIGRDGSRMIRTATVIDGIESDIQYQYTPGNPLPMNLLPFTRGYPNESTPLP